MRRSALITAALALLAACDPDGTFGPRPEPLLSLAVVSLNERIPISFVVQNPCPPVAEQIALQGWLHIQAQSRSVPSVVATVHVNLQEIVGVGLASGLRYSGMATGTSEADVTFPPFVLDAQVPVNARIESQGSNANVQGNLVISLHREPDGNILVVGLVSIETVCHS